MSPQFLRILWKEHRAQKSLWIALACGLLLIHGLILFSWSGVRTENDGLRTVMTGSTIVVFYCYLLAAISIAFAGEEDEGTVLWLRQLPMKTGQLFWPKLLVCITGAIGIAAIGATSAIATSLLKGLNLPTASNDEIVILVGYMFVAILISSLFWSLTCRNVFLSLGLSAVPIGVCLWAFDQQPAPEGLWIAASILVVGSVLIYVKARRWHRGLRAVSKQSERVAWIAKLKPAWLPTWAGWLRSAAIQPTILRRTIGVLLWRECRLAIPRGIRWMVIGLVAVVLRVSEIPELPIAAFAVCLTIIEFGLQTSRHDQRQLNGLFWSHRGVSPILVWLSRQFVWLSALLIITTTIFAVDSIAWQNNRPGINRTGMANLLQEIRVPHLYGEDDFAVENQSLQTQFYYCWVVGGFFLSSLISCWVRPLIAALVASLAMIAWAVFLGNCIRWDIPIVLSALPAITMFIAAAVLSRRHWMDRRWSARIAIKRSAAIGLSMLTLLATAFVWRAVQVPDSSPRLPLVDVNQLWAAGNDNRPVTKQWKDDWIRLSTLVEPRYPGRIVSFHRDELETNRMAPAMEIVDRILPQTSTMLLPSLFRTPWSQFPAQPVVFAMIQDATRQKVLQQPMAALERLVEAIQMTRFLQKESSSTEQWKLTLQLEQFVLQHIHWIASNDNLTNDQLLQIATHFKRAPEFRPTFQENRQFAYTQILFRRGYLWDEFQATAAKHPDRGGPHPAWVSHMAAAPLTERIRLMRLIKLALPNQEDEPPAEQMNRWLATSLIHDANLREDLAVRQASSLDSPHAFFIRSQIATQATWVILQMQAHRRQHGSFPNNLSDFANDLLLAARTEHSAIDDGEPFRDDITPIFISFTFSPNGTGNAFSTLGHPNASTAIDATQPSLLSTTGMNVALGSKPAWNAEGGPAMPYLPKDASRILYVDDSGTSIPGSLWGEWKVLEGRVVGPEE